MVGVVVVAAGSGARLGLGYNKVYMSLLSQPVLVYSLQLFNNISEVSEIVVVTGENDVKRCRADILDRYHIDKVSSVVSGGCDRQQSVMNGLRRLSDNCDIVLVHDGARPCIAKVDVERLVESVKLHGAAALGVPVKDTLKSVDGELNIRHTVDRQSVWAIQTPQGFRRDLLVEAYVKAEQDGFRGTDDCGLVERLGHRVRIVAGSAENIKLTTQDDIPLVSDILTRRLSKGRSVCMQRIGFGYDVHRLVKGRRLFLGGVEFESEYGLDGHSDADVLLHAVADALLGAAALGDIGVHFPPGDPKYSGISSLLLLQSVRELLENSGYRPINVDATIIAERPKVMIKACEMRHRISECLGIGFDAVSVKATTNEGLGSIGAGEGICAHAVCFVEKF